MAHKQKPPPQEEESVEGAPLWIISFADMMSLLMAFFVMLSTFSSFGPAEAQKLRKAMMAALAPNFYGGWYSFQPRTAAGPQAIAAGQSEKGSERPTLEETQGKGLLADTQSEDFRTRKVFVIESNKVFWGAGATLSRDGRDFLDTLAAFAAKVPGRIVIAENGPGSDSEIAYNRALRTLTYLASRGVSKDRCCIGTRGTLPRQSADTERTLEIAILDESTYK
jgi:outer membrane protein OmpA-like peptidoglycan-associated protein